MSDDDASIRHKILSYVNNVLARDIDNLPYEGELDELLSQRYSLKMSDLYKLRQKMKVIDTIQKASE